MRGSLLAVALGFGVAALAVLPIPIPPDRPLGEHRSREGAFIVRTSWRPAGILGAVSGDNPWVYLSLVDVDSSDTIVRYRASADVPEDVYRVLVDHRPFDEPEHPPWEGAELVLTTCANVLRGRGRDLEFARSFHSFHGGGSDWDCWRRQYQEFLETLEALCSQSAPPTPAELDAAARLLVEECASGAK